MLVLLQNRLASVIKIASSACARQFPNAQTVSAISGDEESVSICGNESSEGVLPIFYDLVPLLLDF